MKSTFKLALCLIGFGLVLASCEKDDDMQTQEPQKSELYVRLGENVGISKVVDDFIGVVVGDNRINGFFAATAQSQERVDALKMNLVNQIGEAVGGPEVYTGLSMKAAHQGMGITDSAFDALVEDLVIALSSNGVGNDDINTIGSVLLPMRSDIVE